MVYNPRFEKKMVEDLKSNLDCLFEIKRECRSSTVKNDGTRYRHHSKYRIDVMAKGKKELFDLGFPRGRFGIESKRLDAKQWYTICSSKSIEQANNYYGSAFTVDKQAYAPDFILLHVPSDYDVIQEQNNNSALQDIPDHIGLIKSYSSGDWKIWHGLEDTLVASSENGRVEVDRKALLRCFPNRRSSFLAPDLLVDIGNDCKMTLSEIVEYVNEYGWY